LLVTLALLVAAALTLWYGWHRPVRRLAEQAVRQALPRDLEVARVDVTPPTSISLKGVQWKAVGADEVKVAFSPLPALRDGVASGVERIDVVRPVIQLGEDMEDASPAEWAERLKDAIGELAAGNGPGFRSPGSGRAQVVIVDGEVLAGKRKVVSGVRAVLEPGDGCLASARVERALVHFGGAPWSLSGEYRPEPADDGTSVHGLRFSAFRAESAIDAAGFAGARTDLVIAVSKVDAGELLELFAGWDGPAREALGALGRVSGSLRLHGTPSALELEGRFGGDGLEGGGRRPWGVEVSSGGGELVVTGSGVPIGLLAKIAGRAARGAGVSGDIAGEAEFAVTLSDLTGGLPTGRVDARLTGFRIAGISSEAGALTGRFEAAPGGGAFELVLTLSGDVSGEFRARGAVAAGGVSGTLAVPWAYLGGFPVSQGEFRFGPGDGGLVVEGGAVAAGGRIELAGGRFEAGGFKGTFSTSAASAPGLVELLRWFGVRFEGDRTMTGTVAGTVTVEHGGGRITVFGRLESSRLGYRELAFDGAAVEGSWSRENWDVRSLELTSGESRLSLSLRAEGGRIAGEGAFVDSAAGARLDFAVDGTLPGEIRASGSGAAGEGTVQVDAAWRPHERALLVRGDLSGLPLGFLLGPEPGVEGAASGRYSFASEQGAWRASADIELAGVSLRGLGLREGGLSLNLESKDCPGCLYGSARLWGGLGIAGDPGTGTLDASLHFDGGEGVLNVRPIAAWGGEIAAGGALRLEEGAWRLDLLLRADSLQYRADGLKASAGFDLALRGALLRPVLSGAVTLAEGEVDLLRLPRLARSGGSPGAGERPLVDIGLNVDVSLKRAKVAAGTFLGGEMVGEFALRGTVARPELFGEATLVRGEFRYLGSRFEATKGTVKFRGAQLPVLELSGNRAARGTQVTATVKGPVDDLELVLSSDPPLPQHEILELLNVPASVDLGEGWDELALSLANLVSAELVSQLYWRLGESVEEALDLDQFRLDRSEGSLQLTVGKQVSPNLYLVYSRSMGAEKEQGITAEYRLGPNLTVRSEWDFARKRLIGIQLEAPF